MLVKAITASVKTGQQNHKILNFKKFKSVKNEEILLKRTIVTIRKFGTD